MSHARFPSSKLKLDELARYLGTRAASAPTIWRSSQLIRLSEDFRPFSLSETRWLRLPVSQFLHWLSLPESQNLVRVQAEAFRTRNATVAGRTSGLLRSSTDLRDSQQTLELRFTHVARPQVLSLLEDAKAGRPLQGALGAAAVQISSAHCSRSVAALATEPSQQSDSFSCVRVGGEPDGSPLSCCTFHTALAGPQPQHPASSPLSPSSAQALFAASNTVRRLFRSNRSFASFLGAEQESRPRARSRLSRPRRAPARRRRRSLPRGDITRGQTSA